jgi:hypothetical protein
MTLCKQRRNNSSTIRNRALLLLLLSLLAGCASAHSVKVGLKSYPPKPDSYDTPILSNVDLHAAHLTVIGKLFASQEVILSEANAIPGVVEKMKEKSRKLGADAIINLKVMRKLNPITGNYVISGNADAVVITLPRGNVEKEVPILRKPKEYRL